jgi:hypothetical protein
MRWDDLYDGRRSCEKLHGVDRYAFMVEDKEYQWGVFFNEV